MSARALEQEHLLAQVKVLTVGGKYREALAGIEPLLSSPHVGREARLLRAKLILGGQGPAAAVPELQGLLDASDEVAGQAHLLLANISRESDPCTPAEGDAYYQLWKHHFERAERLIAGTPGYYFLLAQATHDVQKSLSLLAEALKLDQGHYEALRERAHLFQAQGDYEQVTQEARAMIVSQQENPQGYLLRAHALREMGRFDEALQDYQDALRLDPNDPEIYDGRRETYTRLGRYEWALRDAQKCAELRPNDPFYFYKPFLAHTVLGQYDQAAAHYARFLAGPLGSTDYNPDAIPINIGLYFAFFSMKSVFESRTAGQPWHGPEEPPPTGLHALMRDMEALYNQWTRRGKCIAPVGYYCSWDPNAQKLAYCQGLSQGSLLTVLDLTTGRIQALVSPAEEPAWSPDGRYMAFIKDRWLLPPDHLQHLHMRSWSTAMKQQMATHAREVWVMDMTSPDRPMRRIAAGQHPHWGKRSHRLYYYSTADNALHSIPMEKDSSATRVLTDCAGPCPTISPDEQYVADSAGRELRIVKLATREVVETWTLPPPVIPPNLWAEWSPDGNELSLGAFNSEAGLWIYDRRTRTASKILDGGATVASWSPDGRHLAVSLTSVWVEIWLIDLKPGRPTVESFEALQTTEDHCRQMVERCNRWIKTNPTHILAYDSRAYCALWMRHEKAATYLQEFERVLTAYDARGCADRAQHVLRCPPEERDRLLPLALLFARKAVTKEPNFARLLGQALYRAGGREEASRMLEPYRITSGPGSARYDPTTDSYIITGIGADIWQLADDFHFAHKILHGDGSITARIDHLAGTDPWAKAGVMIRGSLAADSAHALCYLSRRNGKVFQSRKEAGQLSGSSKTAGFRVPYWVRLVREGNQISAYHSADGRSWTLQAPSAGTANPQIMALTRDVCIGLAVTSHDPAHTAEARISHVTTMGDVTPAGPFAESQDITLLQPGISDDTGRR